MRACERGSRAVLLLGASALLFACPSAHVPSRAGPLVPHPEPALAELEHRVQAGETLYGIARRYGVTVEALTEANGVDDATALPIGRVLAVPQPGTDGVEPGRAGAGAAAVDGPGGEREPGLGRRAEAGAAPERAGERAKGASRARAPGPVGRPGAPLEWPLRGVLYARFGPRAGTVHEGIDLSAPEGTPVKVAAPGRVLFAGEQSGYGRLVIVEHDAALHTLYAHNRDLRVREGQEVRAGQVIATVGRSGRTSGPHLHFEVRVKGTPVDPLDYLGPVPPR